jgi:hypothetical protein
VPNAAHFDPSAFLPRAEAAAKKIAGDARFVSMSVVPVGPDGRVDVSTESTGSTAMYLFMGTKAGENVNVFVQVTAGAMRSGSNVRTLPSLSGGLPVCTIREVLARTTLRSRWFDVGYTVLANRGSDADADTSPKGRWLVSALDQGRGTEMLTDECTAN